MSRIEQLISDIESYIDTCKYYPLSNVKIIVNKETLEDMLTELRLKTPDEVKKYQKILSNKDAILADAKEQADAIINAAQVQTEELINEHEIMRRAYAQANDLIEQATAQAQAILDNATEEANSIRYGAMQYTDDMLAKLQYIIEHSIKEIKKSTIHYYLVLKIYYLLSTTTEMNSVELKRALKKLIMKIIPQIPKTMIMIQMKNNYY